MNGNPHSRRFLCLVLLVVASVWSIHCKSAPTTKQAEQAVEDLDDIDDFIDESDAPPEKKAQAKAKTAAVKKTVTGQGETIVQLQAENSILKKYKAYVVGFCVAAGIAAVAGLYFGIRWFIGWLRGR